MNTRSPGAWFGLFLWWTVPLQADPNLIVDIEQALTPPVIDGDVGDWNGVRWLRFAPGAPHIAKTTAFLADDGPTEPPGTARTAADLSGAFALRWDDQWIYLAAQVTDNVHNVSGGGQSGWWLKDAVSLFLDVPLDGDGVDYLPGDHTFSFVADPVYPDYGKWWRRGEERGLQEGPAPPETRLAGRLGERGDYILEAAIPMAALTRMTPAWVPPFADRMVGFMFLVTDPDGGPESFGGQLIYGGDDDDDAGWARLRFRPARAALSPSGLATLAGTAVYQDGYSPLELSEVDLKMLLENSLTIVRERAHHHGIALSCALADDLPLVVADERKVRQVVFNLLSNAVKFTPDGGQVGIEAGLEGAGVRVCVWDTGIGIAPADHEKVFRVFEQAESSSAKEYEGTGLGLALVQRFVEQHGGRVWLESALGEGSRFYFTLPLEATAAPAPESGQP